MEIRPVPLREAASSPGAVGMRNIRHVLEEDAVVLGWKEKPEIVLLVKKPGYSSITERMLDMGRWLREEKQLTVCVELKAGKEEEVAPERFVTLEELREQGGDGTLLWVNRLFPGPCPPIVSFNEGTMGFLTPFVFGEAEYKKLLGDVLIGKSHVTLRQRLFARVVREDGTEEEGHCILNEVVVDRGAGTRMSSLDILVNDRFVTNIQADGLIIATTTGSTAYSLSAGGSIVHPLVPGLLITPICAHTLNARPLILPESAVIRIRVPSDARTSATWSGDGVRYDVMERGSSVCIRLHNRKSNGFPCVTPHDDITDWFSSLARCLHWNDRVVQKI